MIVSKAFIQAKSFRRLLDALDRQILINLETDYTATRIHLQVALEVMRVLGMDKSRGFKSIMTPLLAVKKDGSGYFGITIHQTSVNSNRDFKEILANVVSGGYSAEDTKKDTAAYPDEAMIKTIRYALYIHPKIEYYGYDAKALLRLVSSSIRAYAASVPYYDKSEKSYDWNIWDGSRNYFDDYGQEHELPRKSIKRAIPDIDHKDQLNAIKIAVVQEPDTGFLSEMP